MQALKNILLTAAIVVAATMATSALWAIATLVGAAHASSSVDSNMLVYGGYAAMVMALLIGFFYSFFTLFVALVTLPPSIGLMRLFKLPRPLFDMLGGGAAGLLCAALMVNFFEELMRSKGGAAPEGEVRIILDICAMVGGAAAGYVRHAVLVRPRAEQAALGESAPAQAPLVS
jgi:hypothetical protein